MATAFLKQVSQFIHERYKDNAEKLCIILPNKRGALFLKKHLSQTFGKTIWLPHIISAEDLVASLSGLKVLEEIDLLCLLYESYRTCYGHEAEPFDSFAKWGQLILHDFNEIDRYLANPAQLYENLRDIKEIENWSLGREPLTEQQNAYLKFMGSLGAIYRHFSAHLLSRGQAYPGLAYRQAVKNQGESVFAESYHKLLFCGFNALTTAEIKIITAFHHQGKADLLWDADEYYLNNKDQEAGSFLRQNLQRFAEKEVFFVEQNFRSPKDIHIISVPKQIGQAQVVKQCLQKLAAANVPMDKVAVVLANEKLLWPVLQQLPDVVAQVNITMEYPLRYSATYQLIDQLLTIQLNFAKQQKQHKTLYHKDLVSLLRLPLLRSYLDAKGIAFHPGEIIRQVNLKNLAFLSGKMLHQLFGEQFEALKPILQPCASVHVLNIFFQDLLQTLIAYFAERKGANNNYVELEYLHVILKNFNRLGEVLQQYPHFSNLQAYRQLFVQVVGNASAPFIGEPLSGLQIMGVLETRTLDFDHVIFVNVNEGVLPSGKSSNSFIPNDLKSTFGLPLYTERDAIYAYHFYRLLQRATNVTITYDSETDSFGKGEKSRFVTQLELELNKYNPRITISNSVATYPSLPTTTENTIAIVKDEEVLQPLLRKATDEGQGGGFSPSGLITFKECGLKFYFRYSARLKEVEEVEESAEANTFGSILHLSLEELYKEFSGQALSAEKLKEKTGHIHDVVNRNFMSLFGHETPVGKSLLQEEVIKVYVRKLVDNDIRVVNLLKKENKLLVLKNLEQEFSATLTVTVNGTPTIIFIKGKIDRIDELDGQVRIIDYKSSVKDSDKFQFVNFESLFSDKNYNKQFQLMMYAWLLHKNNVCPPENMQPCIVPFKVFSEEPRYIVGTDKKPFVLTAALLLDFEKALSDFISDLLLEGSSFVQTDDEKTCEYCSYQVICNRGID